MRPRGRVRIHELAAGDVRDKGVVCPRCSCRHCPAKKTEHAGSVTIRYRECRYCGYAFRCREYIEPEQRRVEL